ncbi:MAG: hypothetical protein BroJett025_10060 [Patescibacteria group bacterium]|nr:MAG: hypothetical protein BroJett025_10060 [Patescibacteria group bacterium]
MTDITIHRYYHSRSKRILDFFLALSLLTLLSPLIVCLCCSTGIVGGKPVVYKQMRLGKNKKPFILYKIRTMKKGASVLQQKLKDLNEAPYPMFKIANDPRFTRIGKYLSRLGLDEIPQIINIIKGEMSFIGPRPLPIYEASQLDDTWDFRYKVKPGILSTWALSPKRHDSLAEWKKLEISGLQCASIANDIRLIIRSVKTVIFRH